MAVESGDPSPVIPRKRDYWCFISYRHADNVEPGRQWASWLHQALERYEIPSDLVGTKNERGDIIPEQIFPVFRDEEELPADAELSKPIESALKSSRFLVVLCSPLAVQSRWVGEEIRRFKQLGKQDRILAAIIEGEPNASDDPAKAHLECFPEALRFETGARGTLSDKRTEPIAADFRLPGGGKGWTSQAAYRESMILEAYPPQEITANIARFQRKQRLMLLKIVAGILGLPLGVLTQRDKAYQLEKQKQRAKVLRRWVGALAVLFIAAVASGAFALIKQKEVMAERDKQDQLLLSASRGDHEAAVLSFRRGNREQGLAHLERALRLYPKNDAARALSAETTLGPAAPVWVTRAVIATAAPVTCLGFSPDGSMMAAGGSDRHVRFFATLAASERRKVDCGGTVNAIAFSPDGTLVAAGAEDAFLRLIDPSPAGKVRPVKIGAPVYAVAFSPDGARVLIGAGDATARVIECATGKELLLVRLDHLVTSVAFSPDGTRIAAAGNDRTVRIFEADTGKPVGSLKFDSRVYWTAFSPDGRWLGAQSHDGTSRILDASTGAEAHRVGSNISLKRAIAFSPAGQSFAAAGEKNGINLISLPDGRRSELKLDAAVDLLGFSPGGRWIAAGCADHSLRVLHVRNQTESARVTFGKDVTTAEFSPDGRWLAAAGADNTLRILQTSTGAAAGGAPGPTWAPTTPGDNALWRDFLLLQSGCVFGTEGWLRPLQSAELAKITTSLSSRLSGATPFMSWFLSPPETRTVLPSVNIPGWKRFGDELMNAADYTDPRIQRIGDAAPWHPLVPISHGRHWMHAPEENRFFADLSVRRLQTADEKIYGRATIDTWSAVTARWMTDRKLSLEALALADTTLARDPLSITALRAKAIALRQLDRFDESIAAFRELQIRDDALLADYLDPAEAAVEKSELSVVEEMYQAAAARFPGDASIPLKEGWARLTLADAAGAPQAFERASALGATGADLIAGQTLSHAMSGQRGQAIARCRELLTAHPDWAQEDVIERKNLPAPLEKALREIIGATVGAFPDLVPD